MTTDELRATAEYLLRVRDARHESHRIAVEHGWRFKPDEHPEDWTEGEELARAYLAEHPTDDTELLTADWLRSVGFTEDPTDGMFLRIPFPGSLYPAYLCVCSDPNSAIDGGNAMFTSYDRRKDGSDDLDTEDMVVTGKNVIRTRGDVRRLLVAFKIGIPS